MVIGKKNAMTWDESALVRFLELRDKLVSVDTGTQALSTTPEV